MAIYSNGENTALKRKSILIIQTAFLGDCILTLPLINSVKKNISCNITVITRPENKDIFLSCPSVNKVISYDKSGSEKGMKYFFSLVKKVREDRYNTVFIPQRSFRSGLLSFLGGIPERIGFARGGAGIFLTKKICFDWNIHEIDRMLSLARELGCENIACEFNLKPDENILETIKKKYFKTEKKTIAICPQSEWPTKCWPGDRFRELTEVLENDYQVFVLGKEIENWSGKNVVNLTGKTSIKELIALISLIDIMVTNDSGLVHLAAANNAAAVVVFGPTVPGMGFAPYGEKHKIIETEINCRPCSLHGGVKCPRKHFNCMLNISVDVVKKAVLDLTAK